MAERESSSYLASAVSHHLLSSYNRARWRPVIENVIHSVSCSTERKNKKRLSIFPPYPSFGWKPFPYNDSIRPNSWRYGTSDDESSPLLGFLCATWQSQSPSEVRWQHNWHNGLYGNKTLFQPVPEIRSFPMISFSLPITYNGIVSDAETFRAPLSHSSCTFRLMSLFEYVEIHNEIKVPSQSFWKAK